MRKIYLLLLLTLSSSLSAQNSPDFFKTIPHLDGTEPQWTQLMYSENPNVYEVVRLYEAHYHPHNFEKNIHTQNYKYWLQEISKYPTDEGYIQTQNPEKEKWITQLQQKRKAEAAQKRTVYGIQLFEM